MAADRAVLVTMSDGVVHQFLGWKPVFESFRMTWPKSEPRPYGLDGKQWAVFGEDESMLALATEGQHLLRIGFNLDSSVCTS